MDIINKFLKQASNFIGTLFGEGAFNNWMLLFVFVGVVDMLLGNIIGGLVYIFIVSPLFSYAMVSTLIEDTWIHFYKKITGK